MSADQESKKQAGGSNVSSASWGTGAGVKGQGKAWTLPNMMGP